MTRTLLEFERLQTELRLENFEENEAKLCPFLLLQWVENSKVFGEDFWCGFSTKPMPLFIGYPS